jgi:hypothetical protein
LPVRLQTSHPRSRRDPHRRKLNTTLASIEGQRAEDTTEQRVLPGSVGGQTVRNRLLASDRMTADGDTMEISIRDNGHGMSDETPGVCCTLITAPRLRNKHYEFATLELAKSIASFTLVP